MRRPLERVLDVFLADRRGMAAARALDQSLQVGTTSVVERNGDAGGRPSSRRLRVGGTGRQWLLACFAPLVEGRGQTSQQNRLASRRTALLPHAAFKDSSR